MKVELLWWDGCPSHPEARADLETVLREEGLDPGILVSREVTSDEQAAQERFLGSPTIRIDGRDALPVPEVEPFSLTCRVYRLRDGRPSPVPDSDDLRDAIRRAKEDS
jgi:hypothetical protein